MHDPAPAPQRESWGLRGLAVGLAVGGASTAEDWRRTFDWVDRAEALGLHSVWLPEGHFWKGATASPLVALAAFAARTRRLRLATTSLLLPIHHPLRVAEEVAALDALSAGRVILGVGRGFREPLFSGFGIDSSAKRVRFDEALDAILRAWAGEAIALEGDHFATLHGREVRACLRPVQRPHPPLAVAAFGRKGLLQAARRGLPYLASPVETLETIAENLAFHAEHLPAHFDLAQRVVPVMRTLHAARTDAEARRVLDALSSETRRLTGRVPRAIARAAEARPDERAVVGTISQVTDTLAHYRERLGLDLLVIPATAPGASHAERLASFERLVGEVLPALS